MKYKNFKKISEDDKTAVLRNNKGHEIHIVKNALSPQLQNDLAALPIHLAEGGEVKRFKDGGRAPYMDEIQENPYDLNDNTEDDTSAARAPASTAPNDQIPSSLQPLPDIGGVGQIVNKQAPASIYSTPQDNSTRIAPAPIEETEADKEDKDIDNEVNDNDEYAREIASAMPPEQPKPTDYQQAYQQYVQEHQRDFAQEDAAYQQDLKSGHITPETMSSLYNSKSPWGKAGMIFGLMLSGAGSGLAHQQNAALGLLQQELDRNLDAQKTSKINAQQRTMNDAMIKHYAAQNGLTNAQANQIRTMTNIQQDTFQRMRANRDLLNGLYQQTQNINLTPTQRAQAEQQLAMLANLVDAQNYNLGAASAAKLAQYHLYMGNEPNQDNEQSFQNKVGMLRATGNEPLAKDLEEKHIPGVEGRASMPISGSDRADLANMVNYHQQLQRYKDFVMQNSNSVDPRVINEGRVLAANLTASYRQATHGGVYKAGEQDFIDQLIPPDPTAFIPDINVIPKIKALQADEGAKLNSSLQQLGFKGISAAKKALQPQQEEIRYDKQGNAWKLDSNGKPVRAQ